LIVEWQSAEESFRETIEQIDYHINIDEFLTAVREKARERWYKLPTARFCRKIGISSWEGLWADFNGENVYFKKLQELASTYRFETWNQTLLKFNINDPELALKLSLEFKRIRNTKHVLFPETIDTLNRLKGTWRLGLITNGAPDLQWKKINGSNLKRYFDCIIISGDYGFAKPVKRLFLAALNELQASKSSTIMVGDSLQTDIKGAQNIGIKSIWINRSNSQIGDIKSDYEITNLTEMFEIIARLNG
jgi:putative hydrolase of the HAD superfamily